MITSVNLTDDDLARLSMLARALECSRSEVMRRALAIMFLTLQRKGEVDRKGA
jgi:predicted transcriptional regulator